MIAVRTAGEAFGERVVAKADVLVHGRPRVGQRRRLRHGDAQVARAPVGDRLSLVEELDDRVLVLQVQRPLERGRLAEARKRAGMTTRSPTRAIIAKRYVSRVAEEPKLSHLDQAGRARMVDVGGKQETDRRALARAVVRMSPATAALVERGDAPKGDVLATARIAGVQGGKRTSELIPLAHPLPISFIDVDARIDAAAGTITLTAEARTTARTGVEMEALTACAVAALTTYDMVKGVERGVVIEEIVLLQKTGGKEDWSREP